MLDDDTTDFLPFPPVGSAPPVLPQATGLAQPHNVARRTAPPVSRGAAPAADARGRQAALAGLLRHPGIWRRATPARIDARPTGFAALDKLLGGGWPCGALSELLLEHDGLGECSLLLPALAECARAGRRIVLVAPPHPPFAPALAMAGIDLAQVVRIDAGSADTDWTAEQCLRAGCCGAVLSWLPRADYRELRRLQLAAEAGDSLGFVFRPLAAAREASPAALRLAIRAGADGPRVEVLRGRGLREGTGAELRLSA